MVVWLGSNIHCNINLTGLYLKANGESGLDAFRIGRMPFLIATSVVERGLDIAGVDHVINYDMPKDVDEYGKAAVTVV